MHNVTPQSIVQFAVETEKLGAHVYRRLARTFSEDEEMNELLSQLAKDEESHQRQFEQYLKEVPTTLEDQVTYEQKSLMKAMALSTFFSPKRGPLQGQDDVKTREDALLLALELEKATLSYYQAAR